MSDDLIDTARRSAPGPAPGIEDRRVSGGPGDLRGRGPSRAGLLSGSSADDGLGGPNGLRGGRP